jgi:hypothetical protein
MNLILKRLSLLLSNLPFVIEIGTFLTSKFLNEIQPALLYGYSDRIAVRVDKAYQLNGKTYRLTNNTISDSRIDPPDELIIYNYTKYYINVSGITYLYESITVSEDILQDIINNNRNKFVLSDIFLTRQDFGIENTVSQKIVTPIKYPAILYYITPEQNYR